MRHQFYLLWQLSRRDIAARYRGASLGAFWAILSPLLLLVIYTFVFSVVFQARWGQVEESKSFFALNLFTGMILHGFLTETMTRCTGVIQQHGNYVKRVIFPLQLLPLTVVVSSLFHALISSLILVAATALLQGELHWHWLTLPLVVLPLIVFATGLAWALAGFGVFLRDLGQVMPLVSTIMLFTAPVFYPISALPERFQGWLALNPLSTPIEMLRGVLFQQQWPAASQYASSCCVAIGMLLAGYVIFVRLRPGFADAL